ncbi:phage tail protein [Amycolatopsis anabasis]|uniref:phage tail protein n=1 Tax=Amycolatopsis anabasis TaxID=1840409 RepID=UPI00131AA013|nr:phage tail protein [Amycolatopsis anabasis]
MAGEVFASTVFFRLTIGGDDLGSFNSCSGLGAEVEMEQFQEGGNNGFVWQLPSRIRWSNITLTRPVTADTAKVTRWINSIVRRVERKDGEIVALRPDLTPIARWQVLGIVPVRWQGPDFDPSRSEAAVERLEIAHHGLQPG